MTKNSRKGVHAPGPRISRTLIKNTFLESDLLIDIVLRLTDVIIPYQILGDKGVIPLYCNISDPKYKDKFYPHCKRMGGVYIEKNNPTSGVPHNFFQDPDLKVRRFNTCIYFENGQFHCLL